MDQVGSDEERGRYREEERNNEEVLSENISEHGMEWNDRRIENGSRRRELKSKAYKDLLEDLSKSNMDEEMENEENELKGTLTEMYLQAIGKGIELIKSWYDVGRNFKREIKNRMRRKKKGEKLVKKKIYDEMAEELPGKKRPTIIKEMEVAVRVYRIFNGIGGKSEINKMKSTSLETIKKLKERNGEIEDLIREINRAREPDDEIMEEINEMEGSNNEMMED